MAYEKGDQVEPGIWKLKGSRSYLVEVSYRDPETWQRVRKRQTFNRLDMATSWRKKMLDDEKRVELLAASGRSPNAILAAIRRRDIDGEQTGRY